MTNFVRLCILLYVLAVSQTSAAENQRSYRGERFERGGPKPGEAARDFELQTVDGKRVRASQFWTQRPTVIMTGSHTCPVFRNKVPAFERLADEFAGRINFLVVYTTEAHPKGDPSPYRGVEWVTPANERIGLLIPQPRTIEERIQRARECSADLRLKAPVAVDTMDNATWKAYGSAPNCAYLIGRDGKVVAQHGWFDPPTMRSSILHLLNGPAAQ